MELIDRDAEIISKADIGIPKSYERTTHAANAGYRI
jgi:hypothetical protein